MAINMDKIQKRLTELNNRGGNNSQVFWKPKEGETVIRLVPSPDGDPFRDFWFHYNVGDSPPFLSPKKNFGEDDAITDFIRELFDEGTEDSIKMAKSLLPRQRFFSPVIVRGEEHLGVRVWGYGKLAYEELLNLVLNPEYGDITDPETGTDLVIKYGKPAGAQFPQTTITPRRRSSAMCEDGPDKCRELMDNIPDFNGLFERKSVEEVQTILDNFLSSNSSAENKSTETEKYGGKTSGGDTAVNDVDSAFKDLMGS
tara:strand:+ start:355 stop:1122 length:768 start_codon:yes stop_codon:yes gene_type:complete